MGRDRADAVHDSAAADPEAVGGFYDFDEYERLVAAASADDPRAHLVVLLGRRGGAAVRRDDGAGVERRGSAEAAALRAAVRLEGPRDDHQGRAAALRADDDTTRGGASGPSASAERARALPGRRPAADAEDRAGLVRRAARRAQLPKAGVHRCGTRSVRTWRCAARPARAIQELAGHMDLARRSGTCT